MSVRAVLRLSFPTSDFRLPTSGLRRSLRSRGKNQRARAWTIPPDQLPKLHRAGTGRHDAALAADLEELSRPGRVDFSREIEENAGARRSEVGSRKSETKVEAQL